MEKNMQRSAYTREFVSEMGIERFTQMCKDVFINSGYGPVLSYQTFLYDEFREDMVSLTFFDHVPEYLTMAAPIEDIEQATRWVIENNQHLKFGTIERGFNQGDDLECNRESVKMYFALKEPAC